MCLDAHGGIKAKAPTLFVVVGVWSCRRLLYTSKHVRRDLTALLLYVFRV